MGREVCARYGSDSILFDISPSVTSLCHFELHTLVKDDVHYNAMLTESMKLSVSPDSLLQSLKKWHMWLAWGKLEQSYPTLNVASRDVYRAPASPARVESHCNIGKPVLKSRRGRIGEGKAYKKVAVALDERQMARDTEASALQVLCRGRYRTFRRRGWRLTDRRDRHSVW